MKVLLLISVLVLSAPSPNNLRGNAQIQRRSTDPVKASTVQNQSPDEDQAKDEDSDSDSYYSDNDD
jgi:hypothetical protein